MGKIVVIEGTDCSGKSTQYEKLCERLKNENIKFSTDTITYLEEMYVPHSIVNALNENLPQGVVFLNKK